MRERERERGETRPMKTVYGIKNRVTFAQSLTRYMYMYMEIHVFSTLAYENKKEKKGNPPNHYLDKQTYIARDTWMYMYM